jgi:hypothetical protein
VQPVAAQITHDTQPTIVDTLLTLIVFMAQGGGYYNLFCLCREPKIPFGLTTTYGRCDFQGHTTNNRWRSVDAHLHDGTWRELQSVLPSKAAKNCSKTVCNLSAGWFARTRDLQSFMLCWGSISWWGRERDFKFLPIKVAETWIMYNNEQINFKLPD